MRKAIRSVTHLDLARNAGSLFIKSFPLCARPALAGPENLQCRAVFIQFQRTVVRHFWRPTLW
jgi:hypothetical protein